MRKGADALSNPLEKRSSPEESAMEPQAAAPARDAGIFAQWGPKMVVLSDPDSIDAENFRLLRAKILFSKERERPRVIMVTSSFPGEGKTFVAANLAASISLGIDEYVLLVDGDLRKPHLHQMLGYEPAEGLNEFLIGKKTLPELIIRTKLEKLSFLPAGNRSVNPTELLASSTMEKFINEIRGRYDDRLIIIDSTPCQVTAEARTLATYVDGVILVVMARKSPRDAVEKAIEDLGREKILGFVFNGFDNIQKKYYSYYYSYGEKRERKESPRTKRFLFFRPKKGFPHIG